MKWKNLGSIEWGDMVVDGLNAQSARHVVDGLTDDEVGDADVDRDLGFSLERGENVLGSGVSAPTGDDGYSVSMHRFGVSRQEMKRDIVVGVDVLQVRALVVAVAVRGDDVLGVLAQLIR